MIYLTTASSDAARVRRSLDGVACRWAYLGRDYGRTREWERALGPSFQRVSFSARLQELAGQWRERYLDWIASASIKHSDDLAWWTSSIAEKNTLEYSLFHSFCYLQIATEMIGSGEPVLLVAERESLLRAVEVNTAGRRSKRVAAGLREEWSLLARFFYAWTRYAVQCLGAHRDARATRRNEPRTEVDGERRVVLHTCIDESYFGDDGQPRDRYFPGLAQKLRELGYNVRTLPWLYNIRRSRRDAFRWFRARAGEYVIPEDEYSAGDYIWSARVVMRQLFSGRELTRFETLDVRPLIRCARIEQAGNDGTAKFVRYDRLVRRWATRGERLDFFIDMFENMRVEKPQIMALREVMPQTVTVGFQHYAALPPLQLFLRTTPQESAVAPLPDVIVCNSPHSLAELEAAGFPADRLRLGPSLRYRHLLNIPLARSRASSRIVLVVLSLEENASRELLMKLFDAFPSRTDIDFRIKVHPMAPPDFLRDLLDPLPEGYQRASGELAPLLAGAACAVVVASTSAFELALAGVPLVICGRESDFDQNPLAGYSEFGAPAVGVDDLRKAVSDRLSLSTARWERLREWAARMREEAFSPVTEETIRAFVEQPRATTAVATSMDCR